MDSPCLSRILNALALSGFLFSASSPAQQIWPGMETYLKWVDSPEIGIKNLYSEGLVAYHWVDECSRNRSGGSDAALTLTKPLEPGKTQRMGFERPECIHITAALFADGKELGDPAVLRQMHDCRSAEAEEFHQTLLEDRPKIYLSTWDPESSLSRLYAREGVFKESLNSGDPDEVNIHGCHLIGLETLIGMFKDYQSSVAAEPAKYGRRKGLFLRYLEGIDDALSSITYPSGQTWWK